MQSQPAVRFLDNTTPPHLVTLVLLAGLSALAMNVFLPSLPQMTAYFQTEHTLMQLSVAIYLWVNAALQVVIGPVSDKFGRRPVILWGLALFLLATLGCVLATDVTVFLIFRMCQAVIVSAMVLSRAVVRDMVAEDQAASRIAYVTMGVAVVPMIGPMIGGVLGELMGWQAVFWMLLLLGVAMMWLAWRDLGETSRSRGLTLGQQFREYPELLTSPRFWGYALACATASGSFFAYLGGAPFVGSELFGLSEAEVGLYFAIPAVGYFLGNFFSGRFSARYGINRMILWGSIVLAGGMAGALVVFAMGMGSALSFFGFMWFMGFGNGMVVPNATAGTLTVRPHLAGTASGLGGAIMLGGGGALSALAGGLLSVQSGAWPLLWLMLATSVASLICILLVIRRDRRLAGLDLAR